MLMAKMSLLDSSSLILQFVFHGLRVLRSEIINMILIKAQQNVDVNNIANKLYHVHLVRDQNVAQ